MSTDESTNAPENQDGNESGDTTSDAGESAFKPIESQEDLNSVIADRLKRERAKFGDYDDLKAKASRLDEIEEANKSELEKVTDRVTAAEAQRDQALAETLRLRTAVKFGISEEDAALFLTGTDEETLEAQAKRLAERVETSSGPRQPKPDPNQGNRSNGGSPTTADQFANWAEAQLKG